MRRAPPPSQKPTSQPDGASALKLNAQYAPEAERSLNSEDILRGAKAVVIQHLGSHYRLQATKQGKLILTK